MFSWDRRFWQLTAPGEIGGRGMSPSQVKALTLRELYLYSMDEKDLGGVHAMSKSEAEQYIDPAKQNRPEKKVKWIDPVARMIEMYRDHFGFDPTPELIAGWEEDVARRANRANRKRK